MFLKRCHNHTTNNSNLREVTVSVVPATPSPNANNAFGRSRRPLHGTSSLTIHNTASLSLQEFNELMNSIQSLQQIQRNSQFNLNQPLPPPYETVARTNSYRSLRF